MNVDRILDTLNRHSVDYLLIGGMNFLLRHRPELTFDVDLWIADTTENRQRCAQALAELDAAWGPTDTAWASVRGLAGDWLVRQAVFCLTSPEGAIDIFRTVRGLPDWASCAQRAVAGCTAAGVPFRGLGDADMLAAQLALEPQQRKATRVDYLQQFLQQHMGT